MVDNKNAGFEDINLELIYKFSKNCQKKYDKHNVPPKIEAIFNYIALIKSTRKILRQ